MDHKLILSLKLERPRPPKLVCMHVTSTPICINFLSQFWSIKIFHDHGLCPEREILPFLKGSHISETERVTPTKTGVHAHDFNPYLHRFFELILIGYIFWQWWTKRNFGQIQKLILFPKVEKPCPPNLVCMLTLSTSTCLNFLKQFCSAQCFVRFPFWAPWL